jgi:hypothetical protein
MSLEVTHQTHLPPRTILRPEDTNGTKLGGQYSLIHTLVSYRVSAETLALSARIASGNTKPSAQKWVGRVVIGQLHVLSLVLQVKTLGGENSPITNRGQTIAGMTLNHASGSWSLGSPPELQGRWIMVVFQPQPMLLCLWCGPN